jgi:hypothetical protein
LQIKLAARQAQEVHRRAVLLRRDYFMFPVPNEILREAMIAMSENTLSDARRKIRGVARLWGTWARANPGAPRWPGDRELSIDLGGLPAPEAWSAILSNDRLTDAMFGVHATFAYQLDRELCESVSAWAKAMPLEERILLIVVLDLSVVA